MSTLHRDRLLEGFLWTWVVVAFGGYLYQFRDLAGPILAVLGLSD